MRLSEQELLEKFLKDCESPDLIEIKTALEHEKNQDQRSAYKLYKNMVFPEVYKMAKPPHLISVPYSHQIVIYQFGKMLLNGIPKIKGAPNKMGLTEILPKKERALTYFQYLAQRNFIPALYQLADFYSKGQEKDQLKAREYQKKANLLEIQELSNKIEKIQIAIESVNKLIEQAKAQLHIIQKQQMEADEKMRVVNAKKALFEKYSSLTKKIISWVPTIFPLKWLDVRDEFLNLTNQFHRGEEKELLGKLHNLIKIEIPTRQSVDFVPKKEITTVVYANQLLKKRVLLNDKPSIEIDNQINSYVDRLSHR